MGVSNVTIGIIYHNLPVPVQVKLLLARCTNDCLQNMIIYKIYNWNNMAWKCNIWLITQKLTAAMVQSNL